jgi:hypothetical protein
MKRQAFVPYQDERDPTDAVRKRLRQINKLLIEAEEMAASRGLVIGWSRNAVGQLSYDWPQEDNDLYLEFGWTPSSICE